MALLLPFMSVQVLQTIKEFGGLKACMRYLEYLVIESKVQEESVHTELVCLYIQYIQTALISYRTTENRLDISQADNDRSITDLRIKLISVLEGA